MAWTWWSNGGRFHPVSLRQIQEKTNKHEFDINAQYVFIKYNKRSSG